MRKICVINQKGGVGKTTTSVNLAAGLSRENRKVLLIDLDPQGNIGTSLDELEDDDFDIYDALTGEVKLQDCILSLATNLDIIKSKETLTKAEYYMAKQNNFFLLKDLLGTVGGYDYIILDCPPSLGILNQNALVYSNEAIVPVSTDVLGMDALNKMHKIVEKINDNYSHKIEITKIVPTLFDRRNKICKECLQSINKKYNGVVTHPIRINSKIKEAPKFKQSIFKYAKSSSGAKDYWKLVEDVIKEEKLRSQ